MGRFPLASSCEVIQEFVRFKSIPERLVGAETCFESAFPLADCRQITVTHDGNPSTKYEDGLGFPEITDGHRVDSSTQRRPDNSSAVPCEHCGWAIFCGRGCLQIAQGTWHPSEICNALSASRTWSEKARQFPEPLSF